MHISLPRHRRLTALILLCTMVLALLSAQLVGYSHRITHYKHSNAALMASSTVYSIENINGLVDTALHSCLLFDAASITDGLQHSLVLVIPQQLLGQAYVRVPILFWFNSQHSAFNARAPPF